MHAGLSSIAVMSKVLQSTCEGRDFHLGRLSEPVPSSLSGTSNLPLEKTLLQALTELIQSAFKMIVDFGLSIILSNPLVRLLHSVAYRSNAVEPEGSASAAILSDVIEPEGSDFSASSNNTVEPDSAANPSNAIKSKASARIELLENLVYWQFTNEKNANERLIAVQDAGLLVEIDHQNIDNSQSDHIEYLTSAQTISDIIKLDSKGIQFNLSAFLNVRPDLLKSGILGALAEFKQDDLTEEHLSKVCDFLSALRPKLGQENTDYSESMLEEKLEALKQLGLSEKNCSVIRDLAPMVQCGIFVNRMEDSTDPHAQERLVTPLSSVINSNPTHVRILMAAEVDLDGPLETGAKSDFFTSSSDTVEPDSATNPSNAIEPKTSARIELLKNLASWQLIGEKNAKERLVAVQSTGLLIEIDQQRIDNAQSDYIEYLTSAQAISEIIKLDSRGMQFNLSAFLNVRPDLLKSGILGALAEFEQDDLTEKQLSKILRFLSSLHPKLAQVNTDDSESMLEEKLKEVKQLGLSEKNYSVIHKLAPMVQCGIFVNRIEDLIDSRVHKREVTPLYYSSVINSNPTHIRILAAAGADFDWTLEAGAKSDSVASSDNAVELEKSTSSPSPQRTRFSQNLPAEFYLEIQKYLGGRDLLNLLSNFIIPTRLITEPTPRRELIDSPALRLHLLLRKVPSQYQYDLANSDNDLQKFILDQFKRLWDSGQFEQVIEKPALFKLLRLLDRIELFNFLQECIKNNPDLQKKLFDWVERSKTKEVQKIAANALELLVKAGIPMSKKDFQGIRVPGADLSYGVFDSTQLQGADLTGVKLRATDLREADLSRAQMAGVQFGEWPYLQEDGIVFCCAFSPDGTTCAVGLGMQHQDEHPIHVYNTSSWEKVHTLTGHQHSVQSVAYSPDGRHIASCCDDHTLRLWDVQSGKLLHIWKNHSYRFTKLAFLPNGTQIVTANGNVKGSVRLLDVQTGEILQILRQYRGRAADVACSPDGNYIVSGDGGADGDGHVWWRQPGINQFVQIKMFALFSPMRSVTFSPNSKQLAFGCDNGILYVWDMQPYTEPRALGRNQGSINSLSYSPDGTRIATGTNKGAVQLWDVESGKPLYTFKGSASNNVQSVTFSPDGAQIAAGSWNYTMRLLEVHKERKNYKVRIGIGGSLLRLHPCHTTRHAGPHRAVREVEVMRVEVRRAGRSKQWSTPV